MEIKYTVDLEVPDEVMKTLASAHLKIDDLVQVKIETALLQVTKGGGAVLVYRAEEGKKKIDLHTVCPTCRHPWAHHFNQVDNKAVPMSDGTMGTRGFLTDPVPTHCSDCPSEKACEEALK